MMVLYGITLVPLVEELSDADPTLLPPFYTNTAEFDGSARRSEVQLRLVMEEGMDQGYFLELAKSHIIAENLEDNEAARGSLNRHAYILIT